MPREAPEIRLIRETLEGVIHPSTASTLLFQALHEHGGTIPQSTDDILALVDGPLARHLAERIGEEMAESVLQPMRAMLRSIAPPAARMRRRASRHEEPTRNVELSSETLPVYILSGSRRFADGLAAALGPDVMSPVYAKDAAMLRARLEQVPPAFVLVDASDFPAIEPSALCEMLAALPVDTVKAIWGADLPYGMTTLAAAQARRVRFTPFDRREGIEPLMDMIRSRRAPS